MKTKFGPNNFRPIKINLGVNLKKKNSFQKQKLSLLKKVLPLLKHVLDLLTKFQKLTQIWVKSHPKFPTYFKLKWGETLLASIRYIYDAIKLDESSAGNIDVEL